MCACPGGMHGALVPRSGCTLLAISRPGIVRYNVEHAYSVPVWWTRCVEEGEGGRVTSPQGERVPSLSLSVASPLFAHLMDMGVSTIRSKQCQKAVPHILPTESVAPICGTPERLAPKT